VVEACACLDGREGTRASGSGRYSACSCERPPTYCEPGREYACRCGGGGVGVQRCDPAFGVLGRCAGGGADAGPALESRRPDLIARIEARGLRETIEALCAGPVDPHRRVARLAALCVLSRRAARPRASAPHEPPVARRPSFRQQLMKRRGWGAAYELPIRFAAGASPPAPPGLLEILPVFLVARSSLAGRRDADPIR
jgi:hypothetical protein